MPCRKKQAEAALQRSGLNYTIVRPGGLKNTLAAGETAGAIVMEGPGYFTFSKLASLPSRSILRSQVAEVCAAALMEPAAANKVVEIIAQQNAPAKTYKELFEGVTL